MRDWLPIDQAPRDGSLVELTHIWRGEPQEIYRMRWDAEATNPVFAPGVTGLWVLDCGSMTWNETDPEGAPTHFRRLPN